MSKEPTVSVEFDADDILMLSIMLAEVMLVYKHKERFVPVINKLMAALDKLEENKP